VIDLEKLQHVTVIGQGNVALDVARILLKPVDELREFDVPEHVLAALSRSRVSRVEVVGRRGPLQLACTTKEVREMMALDGVGFEMDRRLLKEAQRDVEANPGISMARMRKRALGLLKGGSKTKMADASKSWSLEFLKSPTAFLPSSPSTQTNTGNPLNLLFPPSRVGAVQFDLNQLVPPSSGDLDPVNLQARPTGESTTTPTDMVLKSVGYRSIGLPGLPFDERKGIVRNKEGRIVDERGVQVRSCSSFFPTQGNSQLTAVALINRCRVSTPQAGSREAQRA
jgi:adrenodoxin-NADP+ reductase